MNSVSWQRVKAVLEAVLEVSTDQQTTVLDRQCGDDLGLRSRVETLLLSRKKLTEGFLERPLWSPHGSQSSEASGNELERIGPYRLLEQIGHGGMGKVFRAVRETDFEQEVAIKFVDPSKVGRFASDDHRARFERERQMLAYLDHPYIAHLLDGGTTGDGKPYFVMEYVEGEPIDVYCDAYQLGIRQRLELFLKVCSAVEAAHRSLIVHRDLKPGNILVTPEGEPKLLDFGIAKHLDPSEASLTAVGASPMTPRYASPEQVTGAPLTTSSDVYALGVLLYQLLCGRPPYAVESHNLYQLSKVICETRPLLPSRAATQDVPTESQEYRLTPEVIGRLRGLSVKRLRRHLSGDLDAIVLKALRKRPHNRYGSVELLSDDIRNHLNGMPVRARHSTWMYSVGKFVRRQKLVAGLAVALIVCLFILLGVMGILLDTVERNKKLLAWDEILFDRTSNLPETGTTRPSSDDVIELEKYLPDQESQPAERARRARVLGLSLQAVGFNSLAEEMYRIVIETEAASRGRADEDWVDYLKRSSRLYYKARKYYIACNYFEQLESLWREQGEVHRDRVSNLVNWGSALRMDGYREAAAERYSQAFELAAELGSSSHAEVVRIRYGFASLAFDRGELREAEEQLRSAAQLAATIANLDQGIQINIAGLLGRIQDYLGLPDAETTLERNLELRRQLSSEDEDHLDVRRKIALAERDLAGFLLRQGRFRDGEKVLDSALRELSFQSGPEDPYDNVLAETEALRGYLSAAAGDDLAAVVFFQQGYRAVCRRKGEGTFQVEQSALRVAETYEHLGLAEADKWRRLAESRACEFL